MKKFIYVFDKDARDALLKAGFKLLKEDERGNVYIFMNQDKSSYALAEFSYIENDTLTF